MLLLLSGTDAAVAWFSEEAYHSTTETLPEMGCSTQMGVLHAVLVQGAATTFALFCVVGASLVQLPHIHVLCTQSGWGLMKE